MNDDFDPSADEGDGLAGEYALGLLEGEDRLRAERLLAADADFRSRVARWSGRFAPLLDDVAAAPPPSGLWARVERSIGAGGPGRAPASADGSNVHVLRRRIVLWRGYSAAATALAASLAWFLIARPADAPAPPAEPLVAMMSLEGSSARLVAAFDPDRASLVVAPAAGVESVPGHAHELWLIPAGGKPRSMGIVAPGAPRRMAVPPPMLEALKADATLALSVEPTGGSPSGQPTGPVIASGKLVRT